MVRLDRDGRHVHANAAVAGLSPIPARGFLGRTHRELGFSAKDCAFWEDHLREVVESGAPAEADWVHGNATGQVMYNVRLYPELDGHGRVATVLAIARDESAAATEARRTDALIDAIARGTARAMGDAFFRSLVQHLALATGIHYAIVDEIVDAERSRARTLAVWAGDALADDLEYELDGTPCGDVVNRGLCVHPAGIQALYPRDLILGVMGAESYVGTPLRDSAGRVIGLLALMGTSPLMDTSRLVSVLRIFAARAEGELERRHEEAELRHLRKMEAIGQLASGVAHDFNNQLAVVLGYSDLLLTRLTDARSRKWAESIRDAARRSADLTRQLLVFARRGAVPVRVDLHSVVFATAEMVGRSVDRRIEVVLDLRAPSAVIEGDSTQLQSALLNLCVNARDAMPDGGTLTLRSSADPAGVALEVIDTGRGMTEEVKRRLFDPFFTTKRTGAGMGLTAVYAAVARHRGAVTVTSEPGRGSTFRIRLPLAGAAAGAPDAGASRLAAHRALSVLVVDDEPGVREVVTAILKGEGHDVLCAADGEEGAALYRERWRTIDVVILDLVMPVMNGRDCFRRMKAENPVVRALLASGNADEDAVGAAVADGVRGFVQKPFTREELLGALAAVMD